MTAVFWDAKGVLVDFQEPIKSMQLVTEEH
jgi:FMN phosphatase YigB (HAD superfamily)